MNLPIGKGHYWIVVPKWDGADGFQHYKDRDPIWIKNYRSLVANEDYLGLSFHLRGILHGLWLAYAASDRQLRDNGVTLARRLGGNRHQRVTARDLEALNHAGFIQFSDSKPLAVRYRDASLEEKREEKRQENALNQEPLPTPTRTEQTGNGDGGQNTEEEIAAALRRIDELIAATTPPEIVP